MFKFEDNTRGEDWLSREVVKSIYPRINEKYSTKDTDLIMLGYLTRILYSSSLGIDKALEDANETLNYYKQTIANGKINNTSQRNSRKSRKS